MIIMKNLKFLILVLGLIAACGVQAVQLPTTSSSAYTPAPSGYEGDFDSPFGVRFEGSYYALGDYSSCSPGVITGYTSSGETCEKCCKEKAPGEDERAACISYCYNDDPPLSPLDPSTWFIIMFSACVLLAGCLKAWCRKQV